VVTQVPFCVKLLASENQCAWYIAFLKEFDSSPRMDDGDSVVRHALRSVQCINTVGWVIERA